MVKSEIGSAVSSDLLLEEGNYLNDSANFINQQLIYRNSKRALNILLAESNVDQNYVFTDALQIGTENFKLEELRDQIFSKNVDLRKLYLSQKVLQSEVQLKKADRFPSLMLSAGYNDDRQSLDLSNATFFTGDGFQNGPENRLNSVTDTYFANLTLSFNLFNGSRTSRAIKNSLIQENIGQIRIDQLKQSLSRDLSDAYDKYEVRKVLFEINERKHAVAQENLTLSEEKYKNGTINSFDYRTVQNNNLTAAVSRLQALYNFCLLYTSPSPRD